MAQVKNVTYNLTPFLKKYTPWLHIFILASFFFFNLQGHCCLVYYRPQTLKHLPTDDIM